MLIKRRKREVPGINTASTADISFMLLAFFLVTTSMDVDKGHVRQLQPLDDSALVKPTVVSRDQLFEIEITADDKYLVNGQETSLAAVSAGLDRFLEAKGSRHMIAVSSSPASSYNAYFLIQDKIASAYRRVRDNMAHERYGKAYSRCTDEQREQIRRDCPQHISEPQKQ